MKNKLLLGGVVILIGLIMFNSNLLSIGGSTLSIQQATLINEGTFWRVVTVANGGGERLVGNFHGSDLKDNGATGSHDFSIDLDTTKHQAIYPLSVEYSPIYQYDYDVRFYYDGSLSSYDAVNNCVNAEKNKGYTKVIYSVKDQVWGKGRPVLCVGYTPKVVGKTARVQSPHEDFSTDIIVRGYLGEAKTTISSSGQQSATLRTLSGENIGSVRWDGSLWTGYQLPSESSVASVYKSSTQRYYITDILNYNKYLSLNADPNSVYSQVYSTLQTYENDLENDGVYHTKLIFANINGDASTLFSVVNNPDWNGAKVDGSKIILPREVGAYPVLTFTLNAKWLGIERNLGEPQISCNDLNINAGASNKVNVASVKNIGTSDGSFLISLDCPTEVYPTNGQTWQKLLVGKGSTITPVFDLTSSKAGTFKCKVTAKDLNSNKEDSCYTSIDSKKVCDTVCPNPLVVNPNTCECYCPIPGGTKDNCVVSIEPEPTANPNLSQGGLNLDIWTIGIIALIGVSVILLFKKKKRR